MKQFVYDNENTRKRVDVVKSWKSFFNSEKKIRGKKLPDLQQRNKLKSIYLNQLSLSESEVSQLRLTLTK